MNYKNKNKRTICLANSFCRLTTCLFVVLLCFASWSCSKKPRMIPSEEFKEIFIKAAITDSYLYNRTAEYKRDTLLFFEPILKEYGYTLSDLEHTIAKHTMRKSDVISVLMDEAASQLAVMMSSYTEAAELHKQWNNMATKRYSDTLFFIDSIRVRSLKDLDSLLYTVSPLVDGDYTIRYQYSIDTLDTNDSYMLSFLLSDTTTNSIKGRMRGSSWLIKYKDVSRKRNLSITRQIKNNNYNHLEFKLLNLTNKNKKKPYVYIDSVMVIYTPPAGYAQRRFLRQTLYGDITSTNINKYLRLNEKDSSTLLNSIRPIAK